MHISKFKLIYIHSYFLHASDTHVTDHLVGRKIQRMTTLKLEIIIFNIVILLLP